MLYSMCLKPRKSLTQAIRQSHHTSQPLFVIKECPSNSIHRPFSPKKPSQTSSQQTSHSDPRNITTTSGSLRQTSNTAVISCRPGLSFKRPRAELRQFA
ncbi:Hypothetical protein FKW44_020595 [Caligus rogercresseyi]|uniref:Uncharacterized protein n=1 Tax=Caligus rogercresseyi TaxID=217165 RepID=A0A7T8GY14_CALRO|nr:Hypothetical protein FKW44_020595 [Caligus rogercresseyi]